MKPQTATQERVTIAEAIKRGREGKWIANPRYGEIDEPEKLFKAKWSVHMRPDPRLPEPLQYALVERIDF